MVAKKSLLGKVNRKIPSMVDYQVQIANGFFYQKHSGSIACLCFLSYFAMDQEKGLNNIEQQNNTKAAMLYEAIDNSSLFKGTVAKEDRSKMNVCFIMEDKKLRTSLRTIC